MIEHMGSNLTFADGKAICFDLEDKEDHTAAFVEQQKDWFALSQHNSALIKALY
jgi:hypothetical protein